MQKSSKYRIPPSAKISNSKTSSALAKNVQKLTLPEVKKLFCEKDNEFQLTTKISMHSEFSMTILFALLIHSRFQRIQEILRVSEKAEYYIEDISHHLYRLVDTKNFHQLLESLLSASPVSKLPTLSHDEARVGLLTDVFGEVIQKTVSDGNIDFFLKTLSIVFSQDLPREKRVQESYEIFERWQQYDSDMERQKPIVVQMARGIRVFQKLCESSLTTEECMKILQNIDILEAVDSSAVSSDDDLSVLLASTDSRKRSFRV